MTTRDYTFEAELRLMETEGAKKLTFDTTPWSMQAHCRITSQFHFILKTVLRVSYSCLQTPLCTNTHWSKHLHLSQLFSLVFELGIFFKKCSEALWNCHLCQVHVFLSIFIPCYAVTNALQWRLRWRRRRRNAAFFNPVQHMKLPQTSNMTMGSIFLSDWYRRTYVNLR